MNEILKNKLTTKERKKIPSDEFALPKERKYPIENRAHAANAESRAAQDASPAEKKEIDRKVHEKYPSLGKKSLDAFDLIENQFSVEDLFSRMGKKP